MSHLIQGDPDGLFSLHLVEEGGQLTQIDPQLEIEVQHDHLLHLED